MVQENESRCISILEVLYNVQTGRHNVCNCYNASFEENCELFQENTHTVMMKYARIYTFGRTGAVLLSICDCAMYKTSVLKQNSVLFSIEDCTRQIQATILYKSSLSFLQLYIFSSVL